MLIAENKFTFLLTFGKLCFSIPVCNYETDILRKWP